MRTRSSAHLADGHRGERLRDGIAVAIVGPPNAGKSSLLNQLARREAAITSPIAGTTRDVIEVAIDLAGYPVVLADTAGLRDSADLIEQEGLRRALARAEAAGICASSCSMPRGPQDANGAAPWPGPDTLLVANKIDLASGRDAIAGRRDPGFRADRRRAIAELIAALSARVARIYDGDGAGVDPGAAPRGAGDGCGGACGARSRPICRSCGPKICGWPGAAWAGSPARVDVEDLLDVIFPDFCLGK